MHLRAGAGAEVGGIFAAGSGGPSLGAAMIGVTGKLGASFPLAGQGPLAWRGAIYWDPALQAYSFFDQGGGYMVWQQVSFEVHRDRSSIGGGMGFALSCGGSCTNYPGPGFGLVARASYELVKGERNALSLGADARFFFGSGRFGVSAPGVLLFWVVPGIVLSWEHE